MKARQRGGFTLVELLVVISIIGMLMALVMPAVQQAKESARGATCLSNQAQVGKAILSYHANFRRLPGYVSSMGPQNLKVSWVAAILSELDRRDAYEIWTRRNFSAATHKTISIDILQCPSNPPTDNSYGPLAFVVNGGYLETITPGNENMANGLFFHHIPANRASNRYMTLDYITSHDGTSTTVMVSENVQRRYFTLAEGAGRIPIYADTWATVESERIHDKCFGWWNSAVMASEAGRRPNWEISASDTNVGANHIRPSSFHPGGMNMVFADGSGKFVAETIKYGVYKQICTPWGYMAGNPVGGNPDGAATADMELLNESLF